MAFGAELSPADTEGLPAFLVPSARRANSAGDTITVVEVESMPAWDGKGDQPGRTATTYTLVKKRGAWTVAAATKGSE